MGLFKRKENNENVSKKGFSIYSFLQTLSIIGDAIVIALFVFGFQGYFKLNATTISVLLVVLVVCFCLNLFLPWIKRYQLKMNRIVCLVFFGLIALMAVLWIIAIILIVNLITKGEAATIENSIGTLNYLKAVLVISVQFGIASLIASTVIKYKKRLIAFQAILYASSLYCDFYLTTLCLGIKFNSSSLVDFDFAPFLVNRLVITILIVALIFTAISLGILRRVERRKGGKPVEGFDYVEDTEVEQHRQAISSAKTEEKLAELKSMLDKNLITEEEYNKKKDDILSKM